MMSSHNNLLRQLVLKAQKGDTEAFGKVYELLLEDVFRYIYFRVANRDAGDLSEDVFVRVWGNIQSYKEQKQISFRSWVFTIARHIVIDYYRKNKTVVSVEDIVMLEDENEQQAPHFDVNTSLNADLIKRALSYLKDEYQQVIILKYINDFSNAEIVEILGKTPTAVRIIVHRALKELKEIIEKLHPHAS